MQIIVETPTRNHTFEGENLEAKQGGPTLKITEKGKTIAAFKQWTNWTSTKDNEK